MKYIASLLIGALLSLWASGTGIARTYRFDTPDDYNSLTQTGIGGIGSYSTVGGINDGGSISVSNTSNNNLPKYFTEADRLSTSEPITLSLNFKWTTPTVAGTVGYAVVLGIGSNADGAMLTPYISPYPESTTGALRDQLYLGIRTNGKDSNQVNFLSGSVTGLGNTTSYSTTDYTTLTNGAWYEMVANFSPLDDESGFKLTLSLYETNATTGNRGNVILSSSTEVNRPELLNDTVNSFFAVRSSAWSGVANIDNVTFSTPIPEPSTAAILLFGCGTLVYFRKRRRTPSPNLQ